MNHSNKKVMVSVIYRSSNQTNDEFGAVLSNLKLLVNDINYRKPSLSVVTGTLIRDVPLGDLMILILQRV